MKVYLIKWLDAWSQGPGWDDPPKQDGTLCETVGFLIDETEKMITVAGSYDGAKYYQGMMCIPKAVIKSKKVLK